MEEEKRFDRDSFVLAWTMAALFTVCIVAAALSWFWTIWPELHTEEVGARIEAIRNIALTFSVLVALIALYLTWRRTKDATRQVETQIRQVGSSEIGQYHDRFQSALKMLESEREDIQLAGVALIDRIRHEQPKEFDETVMDLFCDLASNKLTIEYDRAVRDLCLASYQSAFSPKVNSRMVNYLISDRLGVTRDKHVSLQISDTRLGTIQSPGLWQDPDVHDWAMLFSGCYIKEVEIYGPFSRTLNFFNCQIDKLKINFWDDMAGQRASFIDCVFAELEVRGSPGEEFCAADFGRQCGIMRCRFDNDTPVDPKRIFGPEEASNGYAYVNGYRSRRDPY